MKSNLQVIAPLVGLINRTISAKQRSMLLTMALCFSAFAAAQDQRKVIVIGFDGADYDYVKSMMAAGELPNLKKLALKGSFAPLEPTNPPQTPVSWSTFATGLEPGKTGIFDFIKRKEGSYAPDYALRNEQSQPVLFADKNHVYLPAIAGGALFLLLLLILRPKTSIPRWLTVIVPVAAVAWGIHFVAANWLPEHIPTAGQVRQGKPIWKILEEQGKSAGIIRLPITFPAESLNGEMISGLGVPDIRAFVGTPSIFTNNLDWKAESQFSVNIVRLHGQSPFQSEIMGPPNKLFYDPEQKRQMELAGKPYEVPKDLNLPFQIRLADQGVEVEVQGKTYPVRLKEWTPWIKFEYRFNPLVKVYGFGRFYLDQLDEHFKLYLTPIHLHPDTPVPLSYPADLAKTLWEKEPYKTMGWALDTWCIGDGLMDEDHFIEDVNMTVDRFETMMVDFLKDNQRDLFVQVFNFTDRVGHIFWRFLDEDHPHYDPEIGPKYAEAFREYYRRMDAIVGKAMGMIDLEKDVLLICSDHGFSSFRYQFNYNTWLVDNGYMKLKKNVLGVPMQLSDLDNFNTPFSHVDWENTTAYALGLGMMFINLEGREPQGAVKLAEYEAVRNKLKADLEAYVDQKTGLKPVTEVFFRDQIYEVYDEATTPDLRVATSDLYRVSWDTTLGGMPKEITEDNPRLWSGDHCSMAPADVPGILFSSVPLKNQKPRMLDMCPSILDLLGVKSDVKMDGTSVF